jgi:hypothetical protein
VTLLDDLDRMLEKRGHRFVRYADDITIYVASKRAAERVMQSTCEFIEQRLKLRVNRHKSAVGHATSRTLLGFGFLKRGGEFKIRIDPKARKRAKGSTEGNHLSQLGHLDGAEDQLDQPLQQRVDGLLLLG